MVGNSVYRTSAESAVVRFISNESGTAYYKVTESDTVPSVSDISAWTEAGDITANTTKTISPSISAGAKFVHILVKSGDAVSNVLSVSMPYDYYYHEDFEAHPENTYAAQGGSPLTPISQACDGNGNENQKVASVSGNNFFSLTSSSYNASVQKIFLPSNYRDGVKALILKGKVMPISEGPSWHEAALFGICDRKSGVLFIDGKIRYADKSDINNISYNFNQWYEIELDINLMTNKYDITVNGTTVATVVTYNDSDMFVYMFAGHSTTAYFDDISFYTSSENLPRSIEGKTANVSDTVYNGNEQKQTVTIEGLTEGMDFDVMYSADCTNAGTVTVTVIGKGDYFGTLTTSYRITKATGAIPVAPRAVSVGKDSITLAEVDGCEYRIEGGEWQDSNVFDGLTIATSYTFCQRYKENTNYKASDASSADISTHIHGFAEIWSKDETHHWKICGGCDEKDGYAGHIYDRTDVQDETTLVSSGTCNGNAVYKYTCLCGDIGTATYEKPDSRDAENHTMETFTYESNGGTHTKRFECCGVAVTEEEHSYGSDDKCVCGEVKPHTHTPSSEWKYDDVGHWRECECGERSEAASHSLGEWTVTIEATLTEDGERKRSCLCGYAEVENIDTLKETENSEAPSTEKETEGDAPSPEKSGIPAWAIVTLSASATVAVGGAVLFVVKKRRA